MALYIREQIFQYGPLCVILAAYCGAIWQRGMFSIMVDQKRKDTMAVILVAMLIICSGGVLLMRIFAPDMLKQWGADMAFKVGKRSYSMATASEMGYYYFMGGLIRDEAAKRFDINLDLQVTHGSIQNIEMVKSGAADFALIQSSLPSEMENLRAIANLGLQYVHIVAPLDSSLQSWGDLAGYTLNVGTPSSGFAALAGEILGGFHFEPELKRDFREMVRVEDIEAAFADGSMDALFTVFQLHAPLVEKLLESGKYKLLPIEHAPSIALNQPGSRAVTIPFGVYGPNRTIPDRAIPTLAVNTLMVTREDMNGAAIKNILETIYSAGFIKKARQTDLTEATGRKVFDPPLHPAAERFYSRNDPVSADTFEIASFFIAAIVFAGSLYTALSRAMEAHRLGRSKKDIEQYFEALITFSERVSLTTSPEILRDEMKKMNDTQSEAERLWLSGKLDTEHMENLYAIYGVRSANALSKLMLQHLEQNSALIVELMQKMEKEENGQSINSKESKQSAG